MFTIPLRRNSLAGRGAQAAHPFGVGQAVVPLRFVAAFAALNLPFWLLGHWFFISRPGFNIELVLPLLAAAVSPLLGVLVLAWSWTLDLAVSQSLTYHFVSPLDFLRSASFAPQLHLASFLSSSAFATAALFAGAAWIAFRCVRHATVPWRPALVVVLALALGDVGNGSSLLWQPAHRAFAFNLAGSPSTTLLVRAWASRDPQPLTPLPRGGAAVDSADVPRWAAAHPDGSVLLLIVESMGRHRDARLRDWLHDQLYDLALGTRFSIAEMQVPFSGSTTSAELRELCGLSGSYRSLMATRAPGCLPARLVRQGWQTVGLHGFSSHMFDRTQWWPALGLQRQSFAEDLLKPGDAICGGGFAGVCDAELIGRAVRQTRVPRTFVYALTLNSHMPLADIDIPDELRAICAATGSSSDVCRLTATLGVGLRALRAALAEASGQLAVIVVGDHAPGFIELGDRAMYDARVVPGYLLTTRDARVAQRVNATDLAR